MKLKIDNQEFTIKEQGNSCLLSVDKSLYEWSKIWKKIKNPVKFSIDGQLADGRLVTFHGCWILNVNPIQESINTENGFEQTVTINYDYYKLY